MLACVCARAADKIYVLLFVLWNAPSYILNYILVLLPVVLAA